LGFNLNTSSLSTYNLGLFWFPAKGIQVGFTHESSDEDNQVSPIGHLKWSIYQKPSDNWKLAFESDLNFGKQTKDVEQTFGFEHKASDETTVKAKINNLGAFNGSVASKLTSTTDITFTSAFKLGNVFTSNDAKVGFGINFKF
jgi:hypothetical protein